MNNRFTIPTMTDEDNLDRDELTEILERQLETIISEHAAEADPEVYYSTTSEDIARKVAEASLREAATDNPAFAYDLAYDVDDLAENLVPAVECHELTPAFNVCNKEFGVHDYAAAGLALMAEINSDWLSNPEGHEGGTKQDLVEAAVENLLYGGHRPDGAPDLNDTQERLLESVLTHVLQEFEPASVVVNPLDEGEKIETMVGVADLNNQLSESGWIIAAHEAIDELRAARTVDERSYVEKQLDGTMERLTEIADAMVNGTEVDGQDPYVALSEDVLEVVYEPGRPFELVLTVGGPHIWIEQNLDPRADAPAQLKLAAAGQDVTVAELTEKQQVVLNAITASQVDLVREIEGHSLERGYEAPVIL